MKLIFDISNDDFDFFDMTSQMSAFSTKYGFSDKRDKIVHVTEEMSQVVLRSHRPLHIVLSYTEMTGEVAVAFMIKDLHQSPLLEPGIDELAMAMVKGMSREVIEEPTKLGYRIKVVL